MQEIGALREIEGVDDARGTRIRRSQLPKTPDVFYELQDAAELVLRVRNITVMLLPFFRVRRDNEHRNGDAASRARRARRPGGMVEVMV